MKNRLQIEVCIGSVEELIMARSFPIDRIELCTALEIGGLTPSNSLLEEAQRSGLEIHVLIRPRAGDFNYSDSSIDRIKRDIQIASEHGARGVVYGVMNSDTIVSDYNYTLVKICKDLGLVSTFHRAFDLIEPKESALEQIVDMAFDRILTSGGQGANRWNILSQLVKQAGGRIQLMAGGGINASNVHKAVESGVDAVHFSGQKWESEPYPGMGRDSSPDPEKLKSIFDVLKRS